VEGKKFVDGWEDLSDKVSPFFHPIILYVAIQIACWGGTEVDQATKGFSMGLGCRRKEDCLGFMELGV